MGDAPGTDSSNELKREAVRLAKASPPDLNAMLAHQKKMIARLVTLKSHLADWRRLNAGIAAAEKSAPEKASALRQERSKLEMLYRTLNDLQALHDSFVAVGNGLNEIIKKLKK